jgi:hypothetical protein
MNKQLEKTEHAVRTAELELVEADAQADKAKYNCGRAGPFQKRMARRLRKKAKRMMSKANRRRNKLLCDLADEK